MNKWGKICVFWIFFILGNGYLFAEKNPFAYPVTSSPQVPREPFIKSKKVPSPVKKKTEWLYEGYAHIGEQTYAAVRQDGRQKLLKVGDQLNGFTVTSIQKTNIRLKKKSQEIVIRRKTGKTE